MNAIAPARTNAAVALMPTGLGEAMQLANMMAQGKLVPTALQKSAADCLMVIEQAMRWQMSPFAVAQEVSVIQGKLMFSGKIVAAAIHTSGVLDGRLHYDFSGTGNDLTVAVTGQLRGESEPRSVAVRFADAKTSNPHWAKSPEQMLSYHAARVWARRLAPEVMLGVYAPEEFDGPTIDLTPERPAPKPLMTTRELDEATQGDVIPQLQEDKHAAAMDRLAGRIEAAQDMQTLEVITGDLKIVAYIAQWRKSRPDLVERYDTVIHAALDRLGGDAAEPVDDAEDEAA